MSLPEIVLDDRSFQDLVSEARTRIAAACPEWTEHNVSDPGITLIELFAWMTDVLLYRVNRIPDKLHVALLEMLGVKLAPPTAAEAHIRFMLSGPCVERVKLPALDTEVGTVRTADEQAIVFQLSEGIAIEPQKLAAYAVHREGSVKDVGVAEGRARPTGADRAPFSTPPQVGDALMLGFQKPIGKLVIRVEFDGSQARGAGVDPDDPPLTWEFSGPGGEWLQANVLEDLTGGFNYGAGTITLELPGDSAVQAIGGSRMHWLRCRLDERTRSGALGVAYTQAPDVVELGAAPVGAVLLATHSTGERLELLGTCDGTPGMELTLGHAPVLALEPSETVEVLEPGSERWQAWELRETFAASGPADRHFGIDLAAGRIAFGPAVRQPDGGWRQYGAVPPKGALVRINRYRHGGGRRGNVAPGTLVVLKRAIPGVVSVTNTRAAVGGVDAEVLADARARAALEIRSGNRAVTAADFELLATQASPQIGRAACVPPHEGGPVRIHLLPTVEEADRLLSAEELTPREDLFETVAAYLDERRLIGTRVELVPVAFRAVSVVVNLQVAAHSDLQRVEQDVEHALYTYLNPLVGGNPGGPGAGWPFGRTLNQGELFGVVHSVDGVQSVKILRIYETNLATGEQASKPLGTHLELGPQELIASGTHVVKANHPEI